MKNTLITFICCLLSVETMQAQLVQKNEPQELVDLINKMQLFYPQLKAQQNQIDIAGIRTDIAKTQSKPVVNGDLSYRYNAPAPTLSFPGLGAFQIQPNSNYNAGVSFSQVLFDFGRVKLGVEKAEQEQRSLKNSLNSGQLNLGYQVANIYYNILFLNKSIVVKDAEIEQINRLKDLTAKKIKDGDALEYDALTTDVRLNNAINQKTDLQNTLQKQVILLNSLTGVDNNTLKGKVVEFSRGTLLGTSGDLINTAQNNNNEIKNAQERIEVAMKDYELAKKFYYPNIVLSGGAGFRNGFVPDVTVIKANYTIGIGATIPIYAGDRNKKQITLAKATAESYKATIENVQNNLTRDIQTQLSDIQTVTEKYKTVDTQINQAQEAEKLAEIRYKNGVGKNIDVTDSQTSLVVTQLAKLQYEYQLILAQLELKRLVGEKFW